MRCAQALDTGAYVLGALAPAERAAYERHLAACPECPQEVARLAVLPGLLGRLEGPVAEAIARDGRTAEILPKAPDVLLPRTLEALDKRRNAQRRRRRWQVFAGVLVAGCLAVAAGLAMETLDDKTNGVPPGAQASESVQPGPPMAMMRALIPDVPVGAAVALTPLIDGTQVYMHCWYHAVKPTSDKWTLRLIVVSRDGKEQEEVTRWTASDGDDVVMREFAKMPANEIGRVEVHLENTPALVYSLS
jgi:anti-sigma factor RsiW